MAGNAGKTTKTKTQSRRRKPAAPEPASSGMGAFSIGAIVAAIAAAGAAAVAIAKRGKAARGSAEHVPTDLMGDSHPGPDERAVDAFRPDPTASIPAGERDAFRPALAGAAAPTLVRGEARDDQRIDAATS